MSLCPRESYRALGDNPDHELKQQVISALIAKIEIIPEGLKLHYVVDKSKIEAFDSMRPGSHKLTNGRGEDTLSERLQEMDFFEFSLSQKLVFSQKIAKLYEEGHSIKEIARMLEASKSTVRDGLVKNGVPIISSPMAVKKYVGAVLFGFYVLKGQLVRDSREQITVAWINELRDAGMSLSAIANELNRKHICPKRAMTWDHSSVNSILKNRLKFLEIS